jgi:hypothetical protein
MVYIVGKDFAYLWMIKLEKIETGIKRYFLLREGREGEFQKGAENHERFLAPRPGTGELKGDS